jgi:hypothetical protein
MYVLGQFVKNRQKGKDVHFVVSQLRFIFYREHCQDVKSAF